MSRLAEPPILKDKDAIKVITELRKKRGHFGTKFITIFDPAGKKIKTYIKKMGDHIFSIRSSIETINYSADHYYANPNSKTPQVISIEKVYGIVPPGKNLPKWIDFNAWFKNTDSLVKAIDTNTKSRYSKDRELWKQIKELSESVGAIAKSYEDYTDKLTENEHFKTR